MNQFSNVLRTVYCTSSVRSYVAFVVAPMDGAVRKQIEEEE